MYRRGNGIRMELNSTRYYPCDDGKRRCQCLNQYPSSTIRDHRVVQPCSRRSKQEMLESRWHNVLRCPKMNWGIYEWTCAIKMLNSAVSNRTILCSRTRRRSNHRRYSALLRIGFRNDRLSRKAGRTIYGDVESAGRSARSWTLCRNGSPQACLTLRATRG